MIEAVKQKVMASPAAQDTLQGALGVGMTATGTAGLAGKIELANDILSLCIAAVGLIIGIATAINVIYKARQNKFNFEQSVKYDGDDRRKD